MCLHGKVRGRPVCWIATVLLAGPGLAKAQPMPAAPAATKTETPEVTSIKPPRRRTQLESSLLINGRFAGTISVSVDAAGHGEIDAHRLIDLLTPLVAAKLKAALVARIAGREQVDFKELTLDGFSLEFDSLSLSVVASLPADASSASSIVLTERSRVPDPSAFDKPSDFAAGINIAASQRYLHGSGGGFEPVQVDLNAIANFGGFQGVTVTGGATYDGRSWERREFRATRDFFEPALRATLGEFTPTAVSFQGSGRILGIGVERAFTTIRPFQNVRPVGRQEFLLDRDANVDVFVNDLRVQTVRLTPGRYNISDFPLAVGSNRVRLVVDDVGGRREVVDFAIFSSADLLTPGVTEFGAAIGLRETRTLHYAKSPAATAFVYRGLNDNLTAGFNFQATSRAVQLGGAAIVGTPVGFFQLDGAASKQHLGLGFGVAASLEYRGEFSVLTKNDLRVNFVSTYRSAHFTDAFSPASANQQAMQGTVLVQWQAPIGVSMGLGLTQTRLRGPHVIINRLDASVGRSFGRVSLNFSGSRSAFSDGRPADTRGAIGLSLRLGSRYFASARFDSVKQRKELEFSRIGSGQLDDVSGEARLTDDRDAQTITGRVAYTNNRFDAVFGHNRLETRGPNGTTVVASDWNFRTFVGFTSGQFAIGRAAVEGFVIAPVHASLGKAQALIVSGDRVIARSGFFGPALIPLDRAYGITRREINVNPLPVGYDLGSGVINVFPGYGNGYRFLIGSDASHIAVGFLVGPAGPVSLSSGTVVAIDLVSTKKATEPRSIFTNRSGRFVADRLAPGKYRLSTPEGHADFTISAKDQGMTDVGTLQVRP
jgi:outer membrane usher protein